MTKLAVSIASGIAGFDSVLAVAGEVRQLEFLFQFLKEQQQNQQFWGNDNTCRKPSNIHYKEKMS